MRLPERRDERLERGLDRIRAQMDVPSGFPPDVALAAVEAARRGPGGDHVDRTDRPFVTLDPSASTDLDQAFALERAGEDILLHYAIADVGFFVRPGDPLDAEAWRRGLTLYLPDERARLYPAVLSEGAASLLPDGPRPAVVLTVRIDAGGDARLDGVERVIIRSRAKLGYDTVRTEDLPPEFGELARRIAAAEDRRDAPRVEFPEQVLERSDGRWELRFAARLDSEDDNAAMSLSANLAVAGALFAAGTGLFRVMSDPDERSIRRLRHSARAFGLDWPAEQTLAEFQRALPKDDPRTAAFLIAVRRASGGASYEPFRPGERPWHSAMAATYAHATAPLRRLADRYVLEAVLAVANGRAVPDDVTAAFTRLPEVMDRSEARAGQVDAAVLDLAEAVLLSGRVGELFDAVVVDEDARSSVIQLTDPAVLARVEAHRVDPGDEIRVRLTAVDVDSRQVRFERVG
jgi:exoribonuclease R